MECQTKRNATPRVVVLGLASCFGCQLQITNAESHLLEILGQIDVQYWQMASSAPEPEGDVDVVIIEGAVSTVESREIVERWRKRAKAGSWPWLRDIWRARPREMPDRYGCMCGMRRNSFHCGASFG